MQHRFHPLVMALATAFAATAQAQVAERSPSSLGEVVVTGQRIADLPENSRLSGRQVRDLGVATSDTAQLLRDVPGVFLQGAGGVSSLPSVHGLGDDRLRITVDGMDLISACANHMNPPLSYIDPSHVDEIKVYTGVSPVSAGGDSIGAAIQVSSKAPRFAKAGEGVLTTGELGSYYRSNGDAFGVNASATLATENFSLRYSGATAESNNYRSAKAFKPDVNTTNLRGGTRVIAGDEVASSAYKTESHQLGMAYRLDQHLFDLRLGYQHIPNQGFPNQHMDMTDNKSTQVNARYTGDYAWGKLEARVYNEHTRHKMDFADDKRYWFGASANVAGMPMSTEGKTTGVNVKATLPLSARDLLRVGGEVQRYRLDDWWDPVANSNGMSPNTFWNINDGKRDRRDLFGEWEATWTPQWQTLLGMRISQVEMDTGTVRPYANTGDANATVAMLNMQAVDRTAAATFNASERSRSNTLVDLSAMARYTASSTQDYEGGYARKSRAPSLYERYTWGVGGMAMTMNNWVNDGNGYVGNMDLKPEVAHTFSLTGNWHDAAKQDWSLRVTPYFSYVDNYIDATCAQAKTGKACPAGQYNYLTLVNQTAHLYGIDVSGSARLAQVAGVGEFSFRGSLAYTRGKNHDTGDNLYNIMPLNARLVLEHRLGNWTNTVEEQLVSGKDDVSATRGEIKTAGYGLLNLRSSYRWQNVRFDIGLDNALNKQYGLPLGGAYIGQGSTMSLSSSTTWSGTTAPVYGVAVPGMGRSLYAGVNVSF